jgi:putative PIN family toxin of toxin-antitoxin system
VKNLPIVVLDTNVLVSALRSSNGASFELLSALLDERFVIAVSVPLVMEYESVLHRERVVPISAAQVDAVIDMICATARLQEIHFLWRPQLRDPKDEMVLEAAVNAEANFLVTHNLRDFEPAKQFEVKPIGPRAFLNYLESRKL